MGLSYFNFYVLLSVKKNGVLTDDENISFSLSDDKLKIYVSNNFEFDYKTDWSYNMNKGVQLIKTGKYNYIIKIKIRADDEVSTEEEEENVIRTLEDNVLVVEFMEPLKSVRQIYGKEIKPYKGSVEMKYKPIELDIVDSDDKN